MDTDLETEELQESAESQERAADGTADAAQDNDRSPVAESAPVREPAGHTHNDEFTTSAQHDAAVVVQNDSMKPQDPDNQQPENQQPESQQRDNDTSELEPGQTQADQPGATATGEALEIGGISSPNLALGAQQQELPFAVVMGKPITELPKDLYIPPEALRVFLEAFEGPLDLLLYLIRRQNIDILEINVSEITAQYMQYVELMDAMHFELAAEYLVMAAMLAEIKSRMLLPRSSEGDEDDEEDPRAQLIRRLQEYERFKLVAEEIDELPRMGRDIHQASVQPPDLKQEAPLPEVDIKELLLALGEVLRRAEMYESHHVHMEKLSTRERMSQVLDALGGQQFVPFVALFRAEEGRLGVVVTFLAVMELIKEALVEIVQTEAFGPIHVKARSS